MINLNQIGSKKDKLKSAQRAKMESHGGPLQPIALGKKRWGMVQALQDGQPVEEISPARRCCALGAVASRRPAAPGVPRWAPKLLRGQSPGRSDATSVSSEGRGEFGDFYNVGTLICLWTLI